MAIKVKLGGGAAGTSADSSPQLDCLTQTQPGLPLSPRQPTRALVGLTAALTKLFVWLPRRASSRGFSPTTLATAMPKVYDQRERLYPSERCRAALAEAAQPTSALEVGQLCVERWGTRESKPLHEQGGSISDWALSAAAFRRHIQPQGEMENRLHGLRAVTVEEVYARPGGEAPVRGASLNGLSMAIGH